MNRLNGKVAIVTGAAQGMGEATVRLFAEEGAKVVATDIREEAMKEALKDIMNTYKDSIIALKLDVRNKKDWEAVVKETVNKFGKIDILINNAAICIFTGFEEDFADIYKETMDTNALGNVLGIQAVLPAMKENGKGSIVNISSMGGLVGGQGGFSYAMSKGATRLLTKDAAIQLAKYSIRVNSVHPGGIWTPMCSDYMTANPELAEAVKATVPLKRFGESIEVAYVSLFLASDESSYMTGSEVVVDGGFTCQ